MTLPKLKKHWVNSQDQPLKWEKKLKDIKRQKAKWVDVTEFYSTTRWNGGPKG